MSRRDVNNRYFHLSASLKKIGKYVGRGKKRSIANAVVENNSLQGEVVSSLCIQAHKQMKKLCSDKHDSILRMTTKPALEQFTWDRVWEELKLNVPLMLTILTGLVPPSKRESKSAQAALCVCASILLKMQNQKINLVQSVIGLVLRAGHATKQVWVYLCSCSCIIKGTCVGIHTIAEVTVMYKLHGTIKYTGCGIRRP